MNKKIIFRNSKRTRKCRAQFLNAARRFIATTFHKKRINSLGFFFKRIHICAYICQNTGIKRSRRLFSQLLKRHEKHRCTRLVFIWQIFVRQAFVRQAFQIHHNTACRISRKRCIKGKTHVLRISLNVQQGINSNKLRYAKCFWPACLLRYPRALIRQSFPIALMHYGI